MPDAPHGRRLPNGALKAEARASNQPYPRKPLSNHPLPMVAPFEYDKSVFINCPFDGAYKPLFEAIVFAVFDCGFQPRCSLETEDAGQVRMEKIFDLIGDCRFAINDLSRADLDSATHLPRFNMPLEVSIPRQSRGL